jgi:hypothetical protein
MLNLRKSLKGFIRKRFCERKEGMAFSGPTKADVEAFSRELTLMSSQDEHMFSSDELISAGEAGFQFDLYHYADFIQSMNRYESFNSIYRQVRSKFWLSKDQFYGFKFTMECLREVISQKTSIGQDEEDFFQALKWVVKTKGLEANEDGLNMRVVKISSVIQDILYLLLHFEKTPQETPSNTVTPPSEAPKYLGLIFTNHPCGLNKDEAIFQSLLHAIEKLQFVSSSQKDSIKTQIKSILETLLKPSIERLKPKVKDETLTLQDQLMRMSKTLVEQLEDSDDVEVRLDTWTGIEADRNATTPELQMQTVILNKMKGFEVYQHHLRKMMSEVILMEIPEESDIPRDTFASEHIWRITQDIQNKKKIQDFKNLDLSEESMTFLEIINNSSNYFQQFENGMQKGLDISKYLGRLIVFRWLRDILRERKTQTFSSGFLQMNLKDLYDSQEILPEHRNSYIGDTIQQFFSDKTVETLFTKVANSFLPKVIPC